MRSERVVSSALLWATNALGAAAFAYPFLVPQAAAGEVGSHASDAPVLFAVLGVLMLAITVAEVRAGRLDARHVALLGLLAGLNAVLRLPGGFAGANLMFLLPIVAGYAFGPAFGFLLGASSMAVSAVATAGMGPWVPFQMWALGWFGGGAGLLRPLLSRAPRAVELAGLAAYGWLGGLLFGAVLNLWFWPFLSGPSEQISWRAGIGAAEAARRYWRFYLATSLAWDSARAIGNVVLVAVFARPVLRLFRKFEARFAPVEWGDPAELARG